MSCYFLGFSVRIKLEIYMWNRVFNRKNIGDWFLMFVSWSEFICCYFYVRVRGFGFYGLCIFVRGYSKGYIEL